ncbi:MAG TPA: hypothetical protein VHL99_00110, partial [Candidatus Binatia bacterium]|nr:hypothetical protein [Candidatus Binatia bacterium]
APPLVNNAEPKGQYIMAPKTKAPSIASKSSISSPPAGAERGRPPGYGAKPAEDAFQTIAIEPAKRTAPAAIKKSPAAKPVEQSDAYPPPNDETKASAGSVNENKSAAAGWKPVPNVGFAEIREKFGSRSRLTEEQKREEWKKYQGRCVEWAGELSYVGDSFLRGLTLGFKHNPQTLTYDVLVSVPHEVRDAALQMKKGGRYTYRATLKKYGGPILPISMNWGCGTEPRVTEHAKAD